MQDKPTIGDDGTNEFIDLSKKKNREKFLGVYSDGILINGKKPIFTHLWLQTDSPKIEEDDG